MSGSPKTLAPANGKAAEQGTADGGSRKKRKKKGAGTWDLSPARDVDPATWESWLEHLAQRRSAPCLLGRGKRDDSPLLWGLPADAVDGDTRQLLRDLARFQKKQGDRNKSDKRDKPIGQSGVKTVLTRLERWLEDEVSESASPSEVVETLAWCHAAAALAQVLPAGTWMQLLHRLLSDVGRAESAWDNSAAVTTIPSHAVWADQLLRGELPWTLARQFPELEDCRALQKKARRTLSAGLIDLVDGEGLPHARQLPVLRPLLACWTRARLLVADAKSEKEKLTDDARNQYEWLVRQALRFSRPDGTMMLGDDDQPWQPEFLKAALDLDGDEDDLRVAEALFLKPKKGKKSGHRAEFGPAVHSNWSSVTLLRPALQNDSPWAAMRYPDGEMFLELGLGRHTLIRGEVETQVAVDGEPVEWEGEFEELCWFSDKDVDYIELELEGDGCRLQRQILLAREDQFLVFADAVLAEGEGEIGYQTFLPLHDGTRFEPAAETREGQLVRSAPLANVLPLALPEWRSQPHPGHLREHHSEDGGRLELGQLLKGRRLYAALFIDLKKRRIRKPLTWRQLTVGEQLTIQPPDVACGFRVQAGKRQWLLYRSLAECRNRTVLGQNLADEFLCGRFDEDGEVTPLIKIETD